MQIVVRQISGLGNQLFQYAAGRFYSKRLQATMRLAIDPPTNAHSYGSPRPFLLSHFCITAPYAELTFEEKFLLAQRRSLRSAAGAYRRLRHIDVFREQVADRYTFIADPRLRRDAETVYLVGYWQAQEIANRIAPELREEFRFREPPTGRDLEVMNRIQSCGGHAVSLHVRRGDYTLAAEGKIALPTVYYSRAIDYFRERLERPVFFVFSDDIPFTRNNLPAGIDAVFVDHNDDASSHQDMRLMSSCRHHIIANSSFSWWGAWLNPHPDRLVYAPKYWHLTADSYFPALYPRGWTVAEFEPRPEGRSMVGG